MPCVWSVVHDWFSNLQPDILHRIVMPPDGIFVPQALPVASCFAGLNCWDRTPEDHLRYRWFVLFQVQCIFSDQSSRTAIMSLLEREARWAVES